MKYKFRAKRLDNGEWTEGNLFENEVCIRIIPFDAILEGAKLSEAYLVDPSTVELNKGERR